MGVKRRWWTPVLSTLLICIGGCKTWQPTAESPRQVLMDERPRAVRVTGADGTTVTVPRPIIRNDSIVTAEVDAFGAPVQGPGMAYGDVNTMELEQFSPARTGILAAALVGLAIGWTQVVGDSSGGNSEPNPPLPKGFTASFTELVSALSGLVR